MSGDRLPARWFAVVVLFVGVVLTCCLWMQGGDDGDACWCAAGDSWILLLAATTLLVSKKSTFTHISIRATNGARPLAPSFHGASRLSMIPTTADVSCGSSRFIPRSTLQALEHTASTFAGNHTLRNRQ